MTDRSLVGRCGLYCGACLIYRAHRDSAQLRESVAADYGRSPEEVRCEGCQTAALDGWDMDERWGKNCRIVGCLDGKGLDFCFQCESYPECEKFREPFDSCLERGENLMENLGKIEAGRVEEWLREEAERWRCRRCGKPVSQHLKECHWCGAEIGPS